MYKNCRNRRAPILNNDMNPHNYVEYSIGYFFESIRGFWRVHDRHVSVLTASWLPDPWIRLTFRCLFTVVVAGCIDIGFGLGNQVPGININICVGWRGLCKQPWNLADFYVSGKTSRQRPNLESLIYFHRNCQELISTHCVKTDKLRKCPSRWMVEGVKFSTGKGKVLKTG